MGQQETRRYVPELALVRTLTIVCDDCGARKRWPPHKIAAALRRGWTNIPDLGTHLYCPHCKERGGGGKNLRIIPDLK